MKLRTFFIILYTGIFFYQLSAQNNYPLVKYKKQTYFKYPYKIAYSTYGMYNYYNYGDEDIMPVADSLPDGKFIAYGNYTKYRPFHLFGRSIKVDTSEIAVIFYVKNGKKNGPSLWYDREGNLRRSGSYINDERDGEWKSYDTYGNISIVENYKDGLLSGDYFEYGLKGKIKLKGHYSKNREDGTWSVFFNNGKLNGFINLEPDSTGAYLKKNEIYYFRYQAYDEYLYFFPHNFDVGSTYGPLEIYYPNGQRMIRRNLISGYYSLNDTTFHANGKIKELYVLLPGSDDTIHNYMYTEYDTTGRLRTETLFMDSYMKYSKHYDLNGIIEDETYDYTSGKYMPNNTYPNMMYDDYIYCPRTLDSNLAKKDTVLLMNATYKDGKPVSRKILLLPFSITLEKSSDKNGLGFDYIVTKDKNTGQIQLKEFYYNKDSTFTLVKFSHSENDSSIIVDSVRPFCNGKLYTGKVIWSLRKSKKGFEYYGPDTGFEVSYKNGILYVSSSETYFYFITSSAYLDFLKVNSEVTSLYDLSKGRVEIFLKNGLPDSTLKIYDKEKNLRFVERYKNALPDGLCLTYDKCKPHRGSIYRYAMGVSSYSFYKNGLKQDTCKKFHNNGKIESIEVYKNDTLNGTSYFYNDDGLVESITKYLNGEKEGACYEYNDDGKITSLSNYKDGRLDGTSTYYDPLNTMISKVLNAKNGYFDGCSYKYFSGSLQKKIQYCYELKDSVNVYYFNNYYDYEEGYASDFSRANTEVEQYYKGGEKASLGKYKNYARTGTWDYWDESGTLIKQIDYYDSTKKDNFFILNNDTIRFVASIKEWYANGKNKTEGYVMKEEDVYDCRVEGYFSKQDVYYLSYWNPKGEQMVKDKNGKLLTYHPNEKLESSTIIKNGLKDSIYKEWDPDGHLTKIGYYKNGQKEGRWLEGDLEGISYIDDQCFSTEEEFENAMRSRKENLHVEEEYYINGEMVKQNSYYTN